MRYFIDLSYDGSNYHGWQSQKNALGIQQVINQALSTKLKNEVGCVGSGRTDTGVHAQQQVAHFDTPEAIKNLKDFNYQLNSLLPKDIAINDLYHVNDDANCRFDALSRKYLYQIHQSKNPFLEGRSYFFQRPLDLNAMNEASQLLLDWTDYQAFSKVHTDVMTFDCKIFEAFWVQDNDKITFSVKANRFLRGMVRALVGTFLDLGEGKISKKEFQEILESRDRRQAGRSVPPYGLYLSQIEYPKDIRK